MDYGTLSLKQHEEWRGKIETKVRVSISNRHDLSVAYTPGVAASCLAIQQNPELSFSLTRRWNTVPVITDGTAVLGLGDIGPEAGMPVMEGKCALFKEFADVDAFPLCVRSKDVNTIVETIKLLEGSFGGINLEDISAPRCFEIEQRLKNELDIPVFHDDQHGTAVVTAAGLLNALKLVGKSMSQIKVVINGSGAAGIAIAKYLLRYRVAEIIICDSQGIICQGDPRLKSNAAKVEIASLTNHKNVSGILKDAMVGADVFIGVSKGNTVTKEMVRSMNKDAIVFTCANPVPEISREDALEAGAAIVGSGSSAKPNQINNVLVFPGLFRGALDVRAKDITYDMMMAASEAIAWIVGDDLRSDYILPYAWDKRSHEAVASAVAKVARSTGIARQ